MGETQNDRATRADIRTIARASSRIADALEELAAQGRDPEVTRARNEQALEQEIRLADDIIRDQP